MIFDRNSALQAACVILRSRVLRGVYTLVKDTGRRLTPLLILPGSTGLKSLILVLRST